MSLKLTSYKGTRDLYPSDMALRNYIFDGWRQVVESYGYEEYMAPLLEPLEVYAAKSGEEIVNDQTYSFTDRGGRQMVIRPEMTPSISRMVAARRQELPLPGRYYSIANFMRYERPQHGREREFWQLNFDLFGVDNIHADIEIISLSYDILKHFGATNDMFTIKVGDRRLTDFIMRQYIGLDDDKTGQIIKLLDRFDKMPREKFDAAASEIINDTGKESKLAKIIEVQSLDDLPTEVSSNTVVEPLKNVLSSLHQHGIANAVYDVRLMRGFDYYTGIVFEAFDEAPENRRAMFGGGRYDGLVSLFGVDGLPVVGAAPGETMFIEFLKAHHLLPDLTAKGPEVTILPFDDETTPAAIKLAQQLRADGLRVSVDMTSRKIGAKTKAAVKNSTRFVVYLGQDDLTQGSANVKDTTNGQQENVKFDTIASYISESEPKKEENETN